LSELTTAIAYIKCDDKKLTNDLLKKHGINVPNQTLANNKKLDDFLEKQKKYVVKPRRGEQGEDVFVDLNKKEVKKLIKKKKTSQTIIEEFHKGVDLRLVVIDYQIVAAATRSPPEIRGDSKHTVKQLIEKLERKRSIALKGEKVRVLDEDCKKCIQNQGFNLNDVLEKGKRLLVRKTANLHTGGTIKDVTGKLCPELNKTAEQIAKIINIPVVGLDLIIENPSKQKYVFVEANERVGLANHEPQPTAEKFIDLLFPTSKQKFKLK
ncbi:MAG: ATP-grasp domain-containing protein, partial [Candidatus Micrarchaeia archaeon]